ncbi:hypothetical protein AAW50_02450 [Mycoplasmopsis canis]|uniref:discoidin domain-containing protein n=1 Tax=Mycoplasmopsis canis TaxID=29555 RepID=UPI0006248F4C|nr:discoidin domain-containing protein [Mycoplasmopsis canis]AKF41267.1 hypothetical protein AAW50_02450 [Mycoplasmopsis canis]
MSEKKRNIKSKVILASGLALLTGSIVTTGVILSQVKSNKKIDEPKPGNEPKFEPVIKLTDSKFDKLSFEVSNLNASQNKGKEFIVVLTNKRDFTIRNEKSITIDSDSTNIKFDSLESDRQYNLSILFKGKIVLKDVFTTKKRPAISAGTPSATNASFVISNINDFKDDLDKVQIVIKNKTNPNSEPIIIKASDLKVSNGLIVFNLENENLGLEPGQTYEANVQLNDENKITNLSQSIEVKTPEAKNIAYKHNILKEGLKLDLYGFKENGKKVQLEYRISGSNDAYTKLVSTENVQQNKIELLITNNLGFDNIYEFQVKYEESAEYLEFENKTTKGEFKSESAPIININKKDGLDISINKLSPNVDENKIFVLYRDKDNSGEWTKKPLKDVLNKETNKLNIQDLNPDRTYETKLVYETGDENTKSTTILSEAEFTTLKNFEFKLGRSFATSSKVLLSFDDNNKSSVDSNNQYNGVTLKYLEEGTSKFSEIKLTKKISEANNRAEAEISSLKEKTLYNWILVDSSGEILSSGSFKTGISLDGHNNFILVENNLSAGVKVSVANYFGYIESEGIKNYQPTNIDIKYYKENNKDNIQLESIKISDTKIQNSNHFSHNFEELNDGNYIFDVSYNSVNPENNQILKVNKIFNINYQSPDIIFNNQESKLTITKLESLNGKTLVIKYKEESDDSSFESVSGVVSSGKFEVKLEGLKSNTVYLTNIEISQNDLQSLSSINGKTRNDFYGLSLDEKISLPYTFETQEQNHSILVSEEKFLLVDDKIDAKISLAGFADYKGKIVDVTLTKAESENLARSADESMSEVEETYWYDHNNELVTAEKAEGHEVVANTLYRENQSGEEASKIIDGDLNTKWNDWAGNQQAIAETGWAKITFARKKDISAVGIYFMKDYNTGDFGPLNIIVQTSEDGQSWTEVKNQSKVTNFTIGNHESIITFSKVNTQYLRILYRNKPSNNNHYFMFGLAEVKVYPPKNIVLTSVMTQNGQITESGELVLNEWFKNLDKNTKYKISVIDKTESTNNKIAEREYTTSDFSNPSVKELKTLNTNTTNPKLEVPSLDNFKKYLADGNVLRLRSKKIDSDNTYINFNSSTTIQEFAGNNFDEIVFDLNESDIQEENGKNVLSLDRIARDSDVRAFFFKEKQKYQFALTLEKGSRILVLASSLENNLLIKNSNPPIISSEQTNTITKTENSETFNSAVSVTLSSLNDYNNDDNRITAYYIEVNSPLASSSPTTWNEKGNITIENNSSTVSFENLKPDTVYKVAFVDKEGNVILSNDRLKTQGVPKLKNTTHGDKIMRYTLSNLKGTQSIITSGAYKIIFSEDKSYSNSSNTIQIENVENFDGTYTFTLEGLKPNATYNYKLVRGDNNELVLSFQDFFKTNKSQNEEIVIGNNFASIKIVNPDYKLREGFYSIARKVTEDNGDKMVLDVLRLVYSENEDFTNSKEFSVSLSENEAELLTLNIQNLKPGTKYYYKLVKGVVKSDIITNSINSNSEPVLTLEDKPVLNDSFTTLSLVSNTQVTTNSAILSFADTSITSTNELGLKYKKHGQNNVYNVLYDYKINSNGDIIFNLSDLENETIYDYSLFNIFTKNEISNSSFSTLTTSQLKSSLLHLNGTHIRFKLTNLDDFVGRKVKITVKEDNNKDVQTDIVTLTNENDEFLWDIDDLKYLGSDKKYLYEVHLLNNNNEEELIIDKGEFLSEPGYTGGGDLKVTTNVRTAGNYDLNKWYTLTTLQEIYSTKKNWKENLQQSLQEVAIFGSNVNDKTYGWHKLIVDGSDQRYSNTLEDKVVYKYIFSEPTNDSEAKLKGVKFEFQLVGNSIQVMILETKVKNDSITKGVNIASFSWDNLDNDITYKAANGVVNQEFKDISGDFISIGGFKFKATTPKRYSRDFSVPQIFRYSVEAAKVALNKKVVSNNNGSNTAGGFVDLNSGEQKDRYGNLANNQINYDVAYEKYLANNQDLLPVNGNFMINASIFPGFKHMNADIYTPGLRYNSNLREKFFKLLKESGQIRFGGSDVSNRNWISFNSPDIIMFADEEFAQSDKYLKEFRLAKRLIWKDGNQLKGLRLTLSDSKDGHGALLGQLDDFVYYLDITNDVDLNSLSWDAFISLSTKQTTHKYMSSNSSGTAISGIRFVTKDESFISKGISKQFINPQGTKFSASIDATESGENSQERRLRLYNAEVGHYTLDIEYPIFYPTPENPSYSKTIEFDITDDNKYYYDLDLSEHLKYNTEYKATLKFGDKVLQELRGINANIPGGFTYFGSNDIKSVSAGEYFVNNNRNDKGFNGSWPNQSERRFLITNVSENLGFNPNSDPGINEYKRRLKSILIGSTRLSDDGTMKYKWSFKVEAAESGRASTARQKFYSAALSDDNTKIIIMKIALQSFENKSWFYIDSLSEYNLRENELSALQNLNLSAKFREGTNITNQILNSAHISEESLKEGQENHDKVGFFGLFIKNKENPTSSN